MHMGGTSRLRVCKGSAVTDVALSSTQGSKVLAATQTYMEWFSVVTVDCPDAQAEHLGCLCHPGL